MAVKGLLSEELVMERLTDVFDPEIHMSIVELGLVYDVYISDEGIIDVTYTLTSPGCPSGPEIMRDAENQLKALAGVGTVTMNLVWSPPWTPERIEPRGAITLTPIGGLPATVEAR